MSDGDTKWYNRELTSNIVGGLVVAILVWFVPWAITETTKSKVPLWVYAVVAGVGLVVMSVVVPLWRRAVWGGVAAGVRWAWGLRVTTSKSREDLVASGVMARTTSLAAERAFVPQPAWKIKIGDSHFGAANMHWLHNWGHQARDTSLTCDREYFELDGEPFFIGNFDAAGLGSTGKQFHGMPTAKGIAEGVDFEASWFDVNGDKQSRTVHVPPEDIRLGRDAAAEKARADGYQEGFKKGREAAGRQMSGEQMHTTSLMADPALADGPAKATAKSSPPLTKARRLEIIEHKAQQIETERQVLQQMYGRATDTPTINKFLDAKADLDDRENVLSTPDPT